ncbi:unnamed protein product [Paramecium pentaurelia]|uniref:Uncharacterized protein n=1 Tax=Paramecium pentaurelia TaxID=43138 RepID=A0A8S1S725_9CILI|nr:unnamed protein product [Paramecium pentaurelia]
MLTTKIAQPEKQDSTYPNIIYLVEQHYGVKTISIRESKLMQIYWQISMMNLLQNNISEQLRDGLKEIKKYTLGHLIIQNIKLKNYYQMPKHKRKVWLINVWQINFLKKTNKVNKLLKLFIFTQLLINQDQILGHFRLI